MSAFDFDTLCSRAGLGSGDGQPLATPIVQSTTFCRDGVDSQAEHQYSRVSNPTVAVLEAELGRLEAAPPAACFTSGLAAESALFSALLSRGDHVILGRAIYGGTTRLVRRLLSGLGVESTVADATRIEALRAAATDRTRLIFVETPANPTLELTDIRAVARLARELGARLAVDNTFQTAVLQQPLELGADVSVYSTTKFIDGHSVAPGGALVSRDAELLERVRFVRKCTGAIQTPFHAWLTLQGLKTLALRIRHQSSTAQSLADWLVDQPGVARVCYPGLGAPHISAADRALARSQHLGHHGAVLTFELEGGLEAARAFTRGLELCRLVEHVGSVETLVTHPATMTHADVPLEQRRAAGIGDGLLRLSVGLESVAALRAELEQALAVSLLSGSPEVATWTA